jgi:DNA polymerase-1
MLKAKWTHIDITTNQHAADMVENFLKSNIIVGAFDTETDGLHIIHSRPFMFQFGWLTSELQGYTYVVDLELQPELSRQVINAWHQLAERLPVYLAHNIKFDLHQLINNGTPYTYYSNLSDTMFYIRYAHDALQPEKGGPPLALKKYATRYIDPNAQYHEHLMDQEKTAIASVINRKLIKRLRDCGATPPPQYNSKNYTMKVFDEMFKDPVFSIDQLSQDAQDAYYTWYNDDVPIWLQHRIHNIVDSDDIPYNKLDRKTVRKYAHLDIVWVIECWLKTKPALDARDNWRGVEIENQLIEPLVEMERVGFLADKEYLQESRIKVANYIKQRREIFYELAGETVKVGQHERIREIFLKQFGRELESTKKEPLQQLKAGIMQGTIPSVTEEQDKKCVAFINVLNELRTLEKWYAAYIIRFLKDLEKSDRLYTTINQVGAISGRVTSDFQQFPREPILTENGEELFHPRKIIKVSGGDYSSIVYLDYSQIELRFQALYTILVGHPDQNLCRAYMPYMCFRKTDSEKIIPFNYELINDIKSYTNYKWYLNEAPDTEWTPLDVHGATTKIAFDIDETHPDFNKLRYKGKTTNFAKNYGAKLKRIREMFPEYSIQQCRKIDEAYYKAFPGVRYYHEYCADRAAYAFTSNLFGVKYYNASGHNLINMLIQGSAAYYLKLKIIENYQYRKAHNIKSRWQMQIHDELSWEYHKDDDPAIFFAFKENMEDWPDALVPVVAEMEVTQTCWAEKKKVKNLDQLHTYLST